MKYLIFVGILIIIAIVAWYVDAQKNKRTNVYEDELDIPIDESEKIPLYDKTFRVFNRYNDIKQDSRTDAIVSLLEKIHFWLAVIGLYCLLKMAVWLLVAITEGKILTELINIILSGMN